MLMFLLGFLLVLLIFYLQHDVEVLFLFFFHRKTVHNLWFTINAGFLGWEIYVLKNTYFTLYEKYQCFPKQSLNCLICIVLNFV